MFLSILAMSAFALDCADPTLNNESCTAANAVADQLAVDNPGLVVDGATPARFSTERIYDHFEEIRDSAALNGCEMGGATLEGVVSGDYNGRSGVWSGDWESSADTGTASGTIDRIGRTWSGSYVGDATGDYGDLFATFDQDGKLVGNRDDGFLAGRWIRIRGSRGIFVAVHGTCAGDPAEAINEWYGSEDLTPFVEVTLPVDATVSTLGTGTGALLGGDLTDPEDDGNENPLPNGSNFDWVSISASHEEGFSTSGGSELAYNIFDNVVGSGDAKWCCDDPTVANPVWVAVEFAAPVALTHFTMTSGNDSADRDPTMWNVEGSDNGTDWTPIYAYDESTALWTARNQVLRFDLDEVPPAFTHFRYIAFETPGSLHQLNELELFGNVLD